MYFTQMPYYAHRHRTAVAADSPRHGELETVFCRDTRVQT